MSVEEVEEPLYTYRKSYPDSMLKEVKVSLMEVLSGFTRVMVQVELLVYVLASVSLRTASRPAEATYMNPVAQLNSGNQGATCA
jgi:hypothetical protein